MARHDFIKAPFFILRARDPGGFCNAREYRAVVNAGDFRLRVPVGYDDDAAPAQFQQRLKAAKAFAGSMQRVMRDDCVRYRRARIAQPVGDFFKPGFQRRAEKRPSPDFAPLHAGAFAEIAGFGRDGFGDMREKVARKLRLAGPVATDDSDQRGQRVISRR